MVDSGLLIWVYPDDASSPTPFVDPWHKFEHLGPDRRYSATFTLTFDQPWWLWGPSIIDGTHLDHVHTTSLPLLGRQRWRGHFYPEVSPALYAITINEGDPFVGVLAQAYLCPTRENEDKHFLIVSPLSKVLPRRIWFKSFANGGMYGAYEPSSRGEARRGSDKAPGTPIGWRVPPGRELHPFLHQVAVRLALLTRPPQGTTSLPDV